jgi:hypothetical protein
LLKVEVQTSVHVHTPVSNIVKKIS